MHSKIMQNYSTTLVCTKQSSAAVQVALQPNEKRAIIISTAIVRGRPGNANKEFQQQYIARKNRTVQIEEKGLRDQYSIHEALQITEK